MTLKVLAVIPARFASTRFPGKPLALIKSKTMLQRVYEQAKKQLLLIRLSLLQTMMILPIMPDSLVQR